MRLTLRDFMARYAVYQQVFDIENMLAANRTTYADVRRKQEQAEEWF